MLFCKPVNNIDPSAPLHNVGLVGVEVKVGTGFTVTTAVVRQPLLSVYVIVVLPTATPVTKPVEFTVALAVVEEVHGVEDAAVPEPVNCVVEPTHTDNVPEIVGNGLMVTVNVS